MQVITIHAATFLSETVTCEQVQQIALALGKSQTYIDKMLAQPLKGASVGNGRSGKGASSGVGNLSCAKLRTIVMKLLSEPNELVTAWLPNGSFDFEFTGPAFPDEAPADDISKAGANKTRTSGTRKTSGALKGAYRVAKQGLKCTVEQDPEKYALWQHVWNSTSFEQYFAAAPAKAITKTGRIITAASEMAWAVKSGWVVPTAS